MEDTFDIESDHEDEEEISRLPRNGVAKHSGPAKKGGPAKKDATSSFRQNSIHM